MTTGTGGAAPIGGFSSRSTVQTITQFPQRDEALMSNLQPEPGFSNSKPAKDAPADVVTEQKVLDSADVEDKAVAKKATAKKAAKKR